MASSSKKAKTDHTEEFAQVRKYIQECPHVSPDHPAIIAALKGLDGELKRIERDRKLQSKFMQDAVTVEKPAVSDEQKKTEHSSNSNNKPEGKKVEASTDEPMTDDWQDITDENPSNSQHHQQSEEEDGCSFLGQRLAKASVAAMAEHSVQVSTPLEALALALHAAMRSKLLGFACTGVPEKKQSSGFAAPVRELAPHQFLPGEWNKEKDVIALRYRKRGTGAVVLKVISETDDANKQSEGDILIQVTLYPTSAGEPPSESLQFPLKDHINLDSWNHALRNQTSLLPGLHYKALTTLMSNFAKTFDLGNIADDREGTATAIAAADSLPYVDATVLNLPTRRQPQVQAPEFQFPGMTDPMRDEFTHPGSLPSRRPGDFAGDLAPGGLVPGPQGLPQHPDSGMVMGPDHPLFNGGMMPSNQGGMRPRFDPFGPPGGPTEPEDDQQLPDPLPAPSRRGVGSRKPIQPNRDHMRPPNFFNNNT